MKKIAKKVLQGAVSSPGRYSKLIEEAISGTDTHQKGV
jgi:hypothetical protein